MVIGTTADPNNKRHTTMKNEPITTEAVRNMVRPWLTGDDEKDANSLSRTFKMVGLSLAQWRKVITETKAA